MIFEAKDLIDEFDRLQHAKKEIEEKILQLREALISTAQDKNTEILLGTHKKCSIKGYDKVVYPEDKTFLINTIKSKGLYEQFSSLNYFKLSPRILKNDIDFDIIDLVKKERAFRVSLIDRGV